MASYAVIGIAVVAVAVVLFFVFKGGSSGGGSGGGGNKKPPASSASIDCSKIPNKYPNEGGRQTPPYFRCMGSSGQVCYDIGVSPMQKDGWYDMTQVGEDCTGAPMCRDVAAKCRLSSDIAGL